MNQGEQISLSDLGFSFSRMSQEFSLPMMERTSEPSSKRSSTLSTPTPMFLDLRKDRVGAEWGAFWETDGLSLGKYTTVSFGEFPKEGVDCALWQILEVNPLPKYSLSEKACQGILNRAEKRGKELPKPLKEALIQQITHSKLGGGVETDSSGRSAGKGALIQKEVSACLNAVQDQTLFQDVPTVYGISPLESNSMKSSNPHSGIYEADTARTLDENGGNPNCNQGGMLVIENHPADSRCKVKDDGIVQTLNGRMGTGGGNVPLVMSYRGDNITSPTNQPNPQAGDPCHTLVNDDRNYVVLTEDHFGDYNESDTAASLRKSGGTLGGGGESVVIQSELYKQGTTKESETNMSEKTRSSCNRKEKTNE